MVIFGEDLAACLAAHEIRKINRREEVIIVRSSRSIGYSRRLLPYYAAGLVERAELIPGGLLEVADLVNVASSEAVSYGDGYLMVDGRQIAKPVVLVSAWPLLNRRGAVNILTPEDAEALRDALQAAKEVFITGGVAALPVVDALATAGWKVSLTWNCEEFDSDVESVLINELQRGGNVRLISEPPSDAPLLINFGGGDPPSLPLGRGAAEGFIPVDSSCRVAGSDLHAIGLATKVAEPEGFKHRVACEEEVLLQAMNFAAFKVKAPFPPLRRYFVARFGGRVYASFGLTMGEAESIGYDAAATRIRGWGRCSDVLLKAIASREGHVLGLQVAINEEFAWMLGLLYFIVLSRAKLHEVSRAISPIDLQNPSFEGIFDKAFKALLRKAMLRSLARTSQRLTGELNP